MSRATGSGCAYARPWSSTRTQRARRSATRKRTRCTNASSTTWYRATTTRMATRRSRRHGWTRTTLSGTTRTSTTRRTAIRTWSTTCPGTRHARGSRRVASVVATCATRSPASAPSASLRTERAACGSWRRAGPSVSGSRPTSRAPTAGRCCAPCRCPSATSAARAPPGWSSPRSIGSRAPRSTACARSGSVRRPSRRTRRASMRSSSGWTSGGSLTRSAR
mmetsp:Transcript_10516/g.26039  ORF Transcript_10516/g.26039 Transcript_10516/m.26039 type:complete len:221 (-) Transcript_10516:1399-2061(-)